MSSHVARLLISLLLLTLPATMSCAKTGTAPQSQNFNETARFLAGNGVSAQSPLYSFTKTATYRRYAADLTAGWNRFQKPNLTKITKWWKHHAVKTPEKNVMYPFSGPDIMNVLTFFPDADSYTMFGLENPGVVPNPYGLNSGKLTSGLNGVRSSLNTILRVNFFRTKGMAKNLGNRSFNGITGLMMIFLVKKGYAVENVRKIVIDSSSSIAPWRQSDAKISWQRPPKSKRIPGVEITFRKGSGKLQTVRYFMLNVIDSALAKSSPNFIPYLKKSAPYSTFIKSASYLMHNDKIKFTKIRATVLALSHSIVQDDSGVPLRYFDRNVWNITFHGIYDRPIALFANRMQKDLKEAMRKGSTGPLPFSYGYDYKKGQSNLIIAEKK